MAVYLLNVGQVRAGDVGQAAGGGAETRDARSERAYAAFEGQRFLEAALDFEDLWREQRAPRFLFNAAVSRFALRHQAHAVAYLEEYLALPGLTPEERAEASAQITVARRETVAVGIDVKVAEADAGDRSLELVREPDAPSDIRPVLPRTVQVARGGGASTVHLDAGRWTVRGRCLDGSERSTALVVERVPVDRVTLDLACPAVAEGPDSPARGRRITAAAVSAGGVTALIVGAAVLGVYARGRSDLFAQSEDVCGKATPDTQDYTCHLKFVETSRLAGAGAGVLGVGGGVLLGGLTLLVGDDRVRRRLQWAGVGVGGAVLIGGVLGHGGFVRGINDRRDSDWHVFQTDERVPGLVAGRTAMESLMGLGPGLIVGSAIGLLTDLHARRAARRGKRTATTVAPGLRGVSVTLRF